MNKEQLQKNISRVLNRINTQNEIILSYDDEVPSLEIDLMLDQIRRLYEQYLDYSEIEKQSKASVSVIEKKVRPIGIIEEQPVVEPELKLEQEIVAEVSKPIPVVEEKPMEPESEVIPVESAPEQDVIEKKLEEELNKVEEAPDSMIAEELEKLKQYFPSIPDEQFIAVAPEVESKKKAKPEIEEEEIVPEVKSEQLIGVKPQKVEAKDLTGDLFEDQVTLADKFQDEKKSVYDQVQEKAEDTTIADKIRKHAVASLKSSIGLNDKFAFINDLFKGNLNEYTDAVEQLDQIQMQYEAQRVFGQLSVKYGWSKEDDTVARFLDLIEKRFK